MAISELYPSGSRNQPARRTIARANSHPKYLLENDEITNTSLRLKDSNLLLD
jgi:hypothetical protein